MSIDEQGQNIASNSVVGQAVALEGSGSEVPTTSFQPRG